MYSCAHTQESIKLKDHFYYTVQQPGKGNSYILCSYRRRVTHPATYSYGPWGNSRPHMSFVTLG